jgi:hypothetical protein
VTSVLRERIGYRLWRYVHWLAYGSWPIALVHALGTGSDARIGWMRLVGVACIAVVAGAALTRFTLRSGLPSAARVAGTLAAVVTPIAIASWYQSGPGQHGWARRAGTPAVLLARKRVVRARTPATQLVSAALPRSPFSASLTGTVHERTISSGLLDVVIRGRLSGGAGGTVRLDLRGQPLQGGVSMTASGLSYVPAGTRTVYLGHVAALDGQRVFATVTDHAGARIQLAFALSIDTVSQVVTGTLDATPAGS